MRGRAVARATIRRHVEQCSGCADYEAAVRSQRTALAVALPVAPAAAGLRAAVLGSAAGGSGFGAVVGAGGPTSAAGGLAGLGVNGVVAKVLLATALMGGAGVVGHATVDQHPQRRAVRATPGPGAAPPPSAPRLTATFGAVASAAAAPGRSAADAPGHARPPAPRPHPAAHGHHGEAHRPAGRSHDAHAAKATGKAAAPGQLKAPGAPAQGKALGHDKTNAPSAKPGHGQPATKGSAPKRAKAEAVNRPSLKPAKALKPVKALKPAKAPEPAMAPNAQKADAAAAPSARGQSGATPAAPGHGDAAPPGQAKKQAETPEHP